MRGDGIFQRVSLSESAPWGKRQRLLLLLFSAAALAQIETTRVGVIVFSVAAAQSHFDLMIVWKAK